MIISLTRKGKIHEVLIDDEDWNLVKQYNWRIHKGRGTYYAYGYKIGMPARSKNIFMHRVILNAKPEDPKIDHYDQNGLNNCRKNISFISNSGNGYNRKLHKNNTTGFPGVVKHYEKFMSIIGANREYLGRFDTPEEANIVYEKERIKRLERGLL